MNLEEHILGASPLSWLFLAADEHPVVDDLQLRFECLFSCFNALSGTSVHENSVSRGRPLWRKQKNSAGRVGSGLCDSRTKKERVRTVAR